VQPNSPEAISFSLQPYFPQDRSEYQEHKAGAQGCSLILSKKGGGYGAIKTTEKSTPGMLRDNGVL
jgi:hypothetical protein